MVPFLSSVSFLARPFSARDRILSWPCGSGAHAFPPSLRSSVPHFLKLTPSILARPPDSPASEKGFQSLTNATSPSLPSPAFHDAITLLSLRPPAGSPPLTRKQARLAYEPWGPSETYSGFNAGASMSRIDFIFLFSTSSARSTAVVALESAAPRGKTAADEAVEGRWTVAEHSVLDNWLDGDRSGWRGRTSDHRAVVVELVRE